MCIDCERLSDVCWSSAYEFNVIDPGFRTALRTKYSYIENGISQNRYFVVFYLETHG